MVFNYPLIVHEEDGFWGEFPDVKGCNAQGNTIADIIDDAKGALELHLLSMLEDEEIPQKASDPRTIESDDHSFIVMISVSVDRVAEGKSVRKNVTIPQWMNRLSEEKNINFSQTLQDALMEKLGV